MGAPMGDSFVSVIRVDPDDDNLWYVGSYGNGMYVTRDAGASWENHLSGFVTEIELDPNSPGRVFANFDYTLYSSSDHGQTWDPLHTFNHGFGSLLVSSVDGSIYVGLRWENDPTPNGMYKSTDLGQTWNLYPFGNNVPQGLIPWDIEEDPVNNILYVATEIYNHPSPYKPPFLRSTDGGLSWKEISGALPWHVLKIQVDPSTQDVYALTEGAGLYRSSNFGNQWTFLNNYFILELVIDQNFPNRFFGGTHISGGRSGGVYYSTDTGTDFTFVGPADVIAGTLSLNDSSTRLYASCYASGIYIASICNDVTPTVTLNSPNGGVLVGGVTETVTWTTSDEFFYNYVVEFSADGGVNWVIEGQGFGAGTSGDFDWTVPVSPTMIGLVRVTVTNCVGSASYTSDGFLELLDPDGDGDGDGVPDIFDCNAFDANTYPGAPETNDGLDNQCPGDFGAGLVDEISGVAGFFNPTDKNEFSWPPQSGALLYEVARSSSPVFMLDCIAQFTTDNFWVDPGVPSSGAVFHYLTRAVDPNIGSWNSSSTGERVGICGS